MLSGHKHRGGAAVSYYAGLDVSLEETAICVVDEGGQIVKEVRAVSEPEALIKVLQAIGLPLERVGLEACSLTAWLHDGLCGAGLPAICIETRQANAAMKTMPNKTDRNDARALAQIMRTGWFRQVHVKSPAVPVVALVAGRTAHGAQRDATRLENVRPCHAAGGRSQGRDAELASRFRRPGPRAGCRRSHGAAEWLEPLLSILADNAARSRAAHEAGARRA